MTTNKYGILMLANFPPPPGGVPSYIAGFAPYLGRLGWNVHVQASVGSGGVHKYDFYTGYKDSRSWLLILVDIIRLMKRIILERDGSILLVWKNVSRKRFINYLVRASLGCNIIEKESIDAIYTSNLSNSAPIGLILSKLFHLPLINANFGELYNMASWFRKRQALLQEIVDKSSLLLSMSRHCADGYKNLGINANVKVIPYGVDLNHFNPSVRYSDFANSMGLRDDDFVILFVGRMQKIMGLHVLLDATEKIMKDPCMKIIIVGGSGELTSTAKEMIEKYPKRFFVRENVSYKMLPYYYRCCSVLVAPTEGDRACGSISSIEAMATGKPVIATNVGGIPEIVQENYTGLLIESNNPQQLTTAIIKLRTDRRLLRTYGDNGRRVATELFDMRVTNKLYEKQFTEVLVKSFQRKSTAPKRLISSTN